MGRSSRMWMKVLPAFLVAVSIVVAVPLPAQANDLDVVISEVMYHSPDGTVDDDDYDYIEITNRGASTVDLSGWQITDAVDFVFPAGTTISPGQYLVIGRDADAFAERYQRQPDAVFDDGKLKNSSERIELQTDGDVLIDVVEYDDDPPWPGAADGEGRSLERLNLATPNVGDDADAANWLASPMLNGTPGAENSLLTSGPLILDVDDGSERPAPDQGIPVSATISNVDTVRISYRVGFGDWAEMDMADDAASVGGAGDGVFTAVLPPQGPRTLVRYVIAADNANGTTTSPLDTDTVSTHGVVTAQPGEPSDLPLLDWFITEDGYDRLLGVNRFTKIPTPIVVAYGDTVVDDATIRVRGSSTRNLDKPSMRIELPRGQLISFDGYVDEPVDEFILYLANDLKVDIGWEIADEVGLQALDFFGLRVFRNGSFWGTGAYLTAPDGRYRDLVGYDNAAVYQADREMKKESNPSKAERQWEKKEGSDDFTDIWELTNVITESRSDENFRDLMETLDVPAVVNYWAYVSFLRQKNANVDHFWVRDPEGKGRWHLDPWDLELGLRTGSVFGPSMPLIKSLNRYQDFRDMHARRLKSIIDSYTSDGLVDRYEALFAVAEDALEEDHDIWRQIASPGTSRKLWVNGIPSRYRYFERFTDRSKGRGLPASQSADRPVEISSVTAEAGDVPAVVEFINTSSSESFDLTGWTVAGIDFTFPAGTVLLPGAIVAVTSDDADFRANTDGAFAAGKFSDLPDEGELVLRDSSGQPVHSFPYGSEDLDDDGVVNGEDNCPGDANPGQEDVDGDGLGDVCDADPDDGPLGDADGDEVANGEDNCPAVANADQADADDDGVGDACDVTAVVVPGTATKPTVTIEFGPSRLDVSWEAVAGGNVSYQIRSREASGPWRYVPRGDYRQHTLSDLTTGTEYRVQVRAKINGTWQSWNGTTVTVE